MIHKMLLILFLVQKMAGLMLVSKHFHRYSIFLVVFKSYFEKTLRKIKNLVLYEKSLNEFERK